MSSDLLKEIEKVKFHLRTMGEEMGLEPCPLAWLSIKMDWTEDDLKNVIDMFYGYRKALLNGERVYWEKLRNSLMNITNNDYDTVKDIINALYKSKRFEVVQVCEEFAKYYENADFSEILRR